MDIQKGYLCTDEEYRIEISNQLEYINKLESCLDNSSQHDLNDMFNSLAKLSKNEIFLLYFKTNQLIHITALKSIRILLKSNNENIRSNVLPIFSTLLQMTSLIYDNHNRFQTTLNVCMGFYDAFFKDIVVDLLQMFNEDVENAFQIILFMVHSCSMEMIVKENYIESLFEFLNANASFDIKTFLLIFSIMVDKLSTGDCLDLLVEHCNDLCLEIESHIRDAIDVLESYLNEDELAQMRNKFFSLVGDLCCIHVSYMQHYSDTEVKNRALELTNDVLTKVIFHMDEQLKKLGSDSAQNQNSFYDPFDAFDVFNNILILWDADKMQTYCEKVATSFCDAVVLYRENISTNRFNLKQIFTTLSYIIENKGILLDDFLIKYWNVLEPTWSKVFLYEDHKEFNPAPLLKSFIKHVELDSNPKLVYFCVSKFKEFFELDVLRRKTFFSWRTCLAFYSLLEFLCDKDVFKRDTAQLLNTFVKIQENVDFIEWSNLFLDFYVSLFFDQSSKSNMAKKLKKLLIPHLSLIAEKLDASFIKSNINYEDYDCEKLFQTCKLAKLIVIKYSSCLTHPQKAKLFNFVKIIVEYFEENESNNSFTNEEVFEYVKELKKNFS